ncbi:hypothetical protein NBRC116592_16390 [Colwellia sp. KU-HH00111]|uniref:nitrilase-related carbon-nitrogen hydrolase n=1 Tax=Colwellia sp. KU-HH00111 TaxID=3127652 RepID=UPI00310B7B03
MRVAVAQFATSLNVQDNLATCIRMISTVSACNPSLIVLPQYCNTLPCYTDHNQAWDQALTLDGEFLQGIAEQALKHQCYLVVNVTLQRDSSSYENESKPNTALKFPISVTSCLFSPAGALVHQVEKQEFTEAESEYFTATKQTVNIFPSPKATLGLLTGIDDITYAPSSSLASQGAQLLCHSLSSFALDQRNLHGPARASENQLFIACANKIGPLGSLTQFPQTSLAPYDHLGVGHSQILSPEGTVLAELAHSEEGFTFADIDVTLCPSTRNKCRPDGTNIFEQKRPALYQSIALALSKTQHTAEPVPVTTNVAIFATYKSNQAAIEDVCHYIENNLSDIIQLPELFFVDDKTLTNSPAQRAQIATLSQQLIRQVSATLRPLQYLCTSLIIDGTHQAVIISQDGLLAKQAQLHFCNRYQWAELGDSLTIVNLPLEQGMLKVAMLTADDANCAEIVQIASTAGIEVLLVPFDIQVPVDVKYSLLSRAAENRICVVAASREKTFTDNVKNADKDNSNKCTGLIVNLTNHGCALPQWKTPKFNGLVNQPMVKHQHGKITKAVIHPIAARDKLVALKH